MVFIVGWAPCKPSRSGPDFAGVPLQGMAWHWSGQAAMAKLQVRIKMSHEVFSWKSLTPWRWIRCFSSISALPSWSWRNIFVILLFGLLLLRYVGLPICQLVFSFCPYLYGFCRGGISRGGSLELGTFISRIWALWATSLISRRSHIQSNLMFSQISVADHYPNPDEIESQDNGSMIHGLRQWQAQWWL